MKRKYLSICLSACVLLSALSLTGCGGTAASSEPAQPTEAASASTAEPAASTESEPINYSQALDENGFWVGVNASDYVTLPENYDNFTVPEEAVEVTDEVINEAMSELANRFSTTEQITDRAVVDGDQVNIDFVGSVDGVEFAGGSTNGQGTMVTAGSIQYIDDFLTQIIGHKPGETFNVEVTFPENYGKEELNGKDAVFVTTINYIEQTNTPTIDDDFVATYLSEVYEGAKSVDELKVVLTKDAKEQFAKNWFLSDQGFMQACTFAEELPENMLDFESALCVEYYKKYAAGMGMDFGTFITNYFNVSTEAELIDFMKDSIDNSVKMSLITQAVAEAQGMTASEDAVSEYFADGNLEQYIESYGLPYLKNVVINENSRNFLSENAIYN